MTASVYSSWGGETVSPDIQVIRPNGTDIDLAGRFFLAYGNGRSYGDTCLPAGDTLADMRDAKRIIYFDPVSGLLRAEAGVTFAEILAVIVPHGWFLPVTPGTAFVTVGGAIANDVHGKNHHIAGTLGRYVNSFELLRSDGTRLLCTQQQNAGFYHATIAGMGLTGIILWAELSLLRVASADVDQTIVRFGNINEYFLMHKNADSHFTYSVAWIDAMARGASSGRGLLLQGNHAREPGAARMPRERFRIRHTLPINLVLKPGLRLMNAIYYRQSTRESRVSFLPYFYPLDAIGGWNRLYGPRGFRQFQCIIPEEQAPVVIPELLAQSIKQAGGSGLAVLKKFGDVASPGIMSFPAPGYSLTLDFANRGADTDRLFSTLESITIDARGRVNAYKDSMISRTAFEASYPRWHEMADFIDPQVGSRFSRRMGLTGTVTFGKQSCDMQCTGAHQAQVAAST